MKRLIFLILLITCPVYSQVIDNPPPNPTSAPTATPAPTASPIPTPSPRATCSPAPTATPRATDTPIPADTPVNTCTPIPAPTGIPTSTPIQAQANTFTNYQSITADGITTTPTDRLGLRNTIAAVDGARVQYSPSLLFEGHAYETSTNTDDKHEWRQYVVPATTATSTSTLRFGFKKDDGSETYPMTITNGGVVTVGSNLSVPNGQITSQGLITNSTTAPTVYTGFGQSVTLSAAVPYSDVVVLHSTTLQHRKAVTTDTTALVTGVQSGYNIPAISGHTVVNCDSGVVAIGDQLVISNVADGCARALNTNTDSRITVGRALATKTAGTIATYSSHTTANPGVITCSGAHGWAANQRVVLMDSGVTSGAATAGGLISGTAYYVRNPSGADLELATTSGGTSLEMTAAAKTGTLTLVPTSTVGVWLTKAVPDPYIPITETFTTEANITSPILSRVVLLDGDNDTDSDTLDLQNGTYSGQQLQLIAAVDVDADDTVVLNYADTTCTNCPAITFDKVGENASFTWTGATWVVLSYQTAL